MYVVTVIPIQKGLGKEYLSYFSNNEIPLGTIVVVPLRTKNIDAIVLASEDARLVKSDLKNADFQLKKVVSIKGTSPFNQAFFTACGRMKDYTVSSTGAIIKALLPTVYLENIPLLNEAPQRDVSPDNAILRHEKLIFQALTPDRLSWYRTLIREAFAKKQSLFICVPTRYDIEQFKDALTKGIEQYVFAFHGDMTKKVLIDSYNKCINIEHPILIIGTGMFLSIPRSDIQTIIVEHESSDAYKQFSRPFIDIRSFAEILSSVQKSKLIFGDTLLRPDTLHRHDEGELGEVASPLFRLPQAERQLVVDMKEELDEKGSKKWSVLSDTTKQMIEYAEKHNENVFLFSVRKGLAGVTVCHDCGHTLLCPQCSNPVVLYGAKQRSATKSATNRVFMCNKCGRKETTETRCPTCTSWNLTPLGVGTDRVAEEVHALFPHAHVIQIDREATPTEKEARAAITEFNKKPGSILIGTEMAFSYLDNHVTHSALISLDGLLSIPSFNITQNILHIIEKLHYSTDRNLIIQTRIPDNQILRYILSGNVLPLYREDLKERKAFGYPPFKRLIKITFTGTASETEKARAFLDHVLDGYDPQIFSAFIGKVKGHYITNTVIKIDPYLWPLPTKELSETHSHLREVLSRLPPSFAINVDPEDLL
jgi:primosomal protein N' (replication factor Y) (superfamily II helicase)